MRHVLVGVYSPKLFQYQGDSLDQPLFLTHDLPRKSIQPIVIKFDIIKISNQFVQKNLKILIFLCFITFKLEYGIFEEIQKYEFSILKRNISSWDEDRDYCLSSIHEN